MRRSQRRWSLTRRLIAAAACCGLPGVAGLLLAADVARARWLAGALTLAGVLLLIGLLGLLAGPWTTRRLRERLGALAATARQLTAVTDHAASGVAPVVRAAHALEAETSQLRAALAHAPDAVREMTAWAQWLLPRWETLTARRRSDGALHLLQEMQRLRDAVNEQARASERIVALVSRFVAAVASSRQVRQSMLTRAQDLCATAGSLARGLGQAPTPRGKGGQSSVMTRGMLYRRLMLALPAVAVVPLGVASVALSLWLGNWNLLGRWPFLVGVGGTLLTSLLAGALLARSVTRGLAPAAADLAEAIERFVATPSDQAAAPELARTTASLESAARAVRRGTAMAGGALEWPLRMGQPLFEASAFDIAAGRHLLEVAVNELGQVDQTLPALMEYGTQMIGAAEAIAAHARAVTSDTTRSAALAVASAAAGEHLRAAVDGEPARQPDAIGVEPPPASSTSQAARARWRPPAGAWARHAMPPGPAGRTTGGPARSDHDAPFDLKPQTAQYRAFQPESDHTAGKPAPPAPSASDNERERPG